VPVGDHSAERNLVERFFNQLKHFRAIATRYDKLARNFLAGVESDVIIGVVRARSVHEVGYGHKWDWEA
jgi:hypothetical protein